MQILIKEFINGLPARCSSIEEAALQQDWPKLAACAHKLKGSAGMYGFPDLAACAANMEQAAKRSDCDAARNEYLELQRLLVRIGC
jgi:HPt (histidine-containing phosphotransfer) domain-containing protein